MSSNSNKKSRGKRPDQPLYVPRHLRTKNGEQEICVKHSLPDTDNIESISTDPDIINNSNHFETDALQDTIQEISASLAPTYSSLEANIVIKTEQFKTSILKKNSPIINKSKTLEKSCDINNEDSWFSKFTDDGEAVDPKILEEISDKMGKVAVKNAVINYLEFSPQDIDMNEEEFGHLLEIYDFPKEFATQDLLLAFRDYQSKGFDIKWVDDTHAIAIFAGAFAASCALKTFKNPSFKVRPISQASRQTKLKAKRCTEFLQPQKPRPEMSVHVARNLLAAALGIKAKVSKEQRAEENQKISNAREKKKADLKSKQDAWEGNFNT